MIYLDNNATTQPLPEVVEAVRKSMIDSWQNPSAYYYAAKHVKDAVEEARENVAALVGAEPDEIIFTSGGTESTNTVLNTWMYADENSAEMPLVATLTTEHPATLKTLEGCRSRRLCGTWLVEVDRVGMPLLRSWEEAMEDATCASFCLANNETGVIAPAEIMIHAAHDCGVPVHLDVVQAAGKIPLDFSQLMADYASISSHKIHGPKGIGALYVRRGSALRPLVYGGGQEMGRRSGTLNVPGIIGFGVAAQMAKQYMDERFKHMILLREEFERTLKSQLSDVRINGGAANRLPNTSNVTFLGCSSDSLLLLLEKHGLCCSIASACKTGTRTPSSVLTAMGLSEMEARSSMRFSHSFMTTKEEMEEAAKVVVQSVQELRQVQSEKTGPVTVYKPE